MTTTTQDSLGNIFDAAGNHVGVVPGSQADLGTSGLPALPSLPALPTMAQIGAAASSATNAIGNAAQAAGNAVNNLGTAAITPLSKWFGISLEDVVFIALGLILIAAAVFSFKETAPYARAAAKTATEAIGGAVAA